MMYLHPAPHAKFTTPTQFIKGFVKMVDGLSYEEKAVVKKLAAKINTHKNDNGDMELPYIFDEKETKTLLKLIAFYDGWIAVGTLGKWVRSFFMWVGFMAMAYAATQNWLADHIKALAK